MTWIPRSDAIQATVLTVFGALLIADAFSFPLDTALIAVALVVVAILVFTRTIQAPLWLGASVLGLGLLLVVRNPLGRFLHDGGLMTIAGALLLALGILRLATADCLPDEGQDLESPSAARQDVPAASADRPARL